MREARGGEQGYLYDGRGSVAQTTEQGLVVDSLRYGPYGEVLSGGEELLSYYGFNAEEHNPETGLQYLRARYYAPELGAFTTRDTYGGSLYEPLTQNRYLYALGDPVNFVDPGGMAATKSKAKTSKKTSNSINYLPGYGAMETIFAKD